MDLELLKGWGTILKGMQGNADLAAQALADNEWFTSPMIDQAIAAMLPWFEGAVLADLRSHYPAISSPKRIGLILAGNLPLVGLHDVLMVLLSGHHAVVKPSHKDRVLLEHLLALRRAKDSPQALQDRVTIVEAIAAQDMDFLIATGSNNTARHLEATFHSVPKLIRQNRFSVAVLVGDESAQELQALADDILLYHGMGCRSVSSILVPRGYELRDLVNALERFPAAGFAKCWADVLRYEKATLAMVGQGEVACKSIVVDRTPSMRPGKIGVLNVVEYADRADLTSIIETTQPHLQCIVGQGFVPFGQAQFPAVADFADGVDTLAVLTGI
jgi:hypothetical protein